MVRPSGLTEYFGVGGLRLRDGLDERLHARYRRAPDEQNPDLVSNGCERSCLHSA